jgi:hypothetical protein
MKSPEKSWKMRRLAARSPTSNIASATNGRHHLFMRRLFPLLTLFLAACATRPEPAPPVAQPAPATQSQTKKLVGLTPQELVTQFGGPALQVREGNSLKLHFNSRRCVLDAYLYPSTNGAMRVTWVDTRLPSGVDTDQAACISDLENPS